MITYTQAREHALKCGHVLGPVDAVPLDRVLSRSASGRGAWLAADVLHPETQEVVYPAGYWIDTDDIAKLASIGVDYVILEN
jgi:hypothetical protein